jgi:hypothetical protein
MVVDTGGLAGTTNHQFYGSHKSVQSFYNEYYGLEDFDGVPISEGLLEDWSQMEEERQGWSIAHEPAEGGNAGDCGYDGVGGRQRRSINWSIG